MRKRMWKRAGLWLLCAALCAGAGGCSGTEHRKIETKAQRDDGGAQGAGRSGEAAKNAGGALQDGRGSQGSGENGTPDHEKTQNAGEDAAAAKSGGGAQNAAGTDGTPDAGNEGSASLADPEDGVETGSKSVYFEGADMNGRVMELTDTGFTMLKIYSEVMEDGSTNSWEKAPGSETDEDMLYVTCTEDTVFEIAYFSMSQEKELSRETGSADDVKKQQSVYIWGDSPDGKNWTAGRVLIWKWK